MRILLIGVGMLTASGCAIFLIRDVIKDKDQPWWYRFIELIFALLFIMATVFHSSFLSNFK